MSVSVNTSVDDRRRVPGSTSVDNRTRASDSTSADDRTRVLVIDDDPGIRALVAEVLEWEGYAVEMATDGAEALRRVRQAPPGAILLDLMMPVMNGWQFVDACNSDGVCKDVPMLVLSAAHDLRTAPEQLRHNGVTAVLPKPFNIDGLVDAVKELSSPA